MCCCFSLLLSSLYLPLIFSPSHASFVLFLLSFSLPLSLSLYLQLSDSLPHSSSPLQQAIQLTFLIINTSRCSSPLSATLTLIFEQLTRSSLAEHNGNGNGASFAAAESELQLRKAGIGPGSARMVGELDSHRVEEGVLAWLAARLLLH